MMHRETRINVRNTEHGCSDDSDSYSLSRHNGSTLSSRYSKSIPVLWRVVFDKEPAWWKINRIAYTLFP